MEIPDLPEPDLGDPGSTPLLTPRPSNPVPARSSSPPLPPRQNAAGLPPTYLAHLRALLQQWLQQQHVSNQQFAGTQEPTALWNEIRLSQIEEAIWRGAIVPDTSGKKRLLNLEWKEWAPGCNRRKKAWREAKRSVPAVQNPIETRPPSLHQDEKARGKLALPALTSGSATPTQSTRPSSVVSADKVQPEGAKSPFNPSSQGSGDDVEEWRTEYLRILSSLRGYQEFVSTLKEGWEVMETGSQLPPTDHRELPGAFPQGAHFRKPSLPTDLSRAKIHSEPPVIIGEDDLVKPVFCAHFTAPVHTGSTSTVHLRRQSSFSQNSHWESVSSASGRWWANNGPNRRWHDFGSGFGVETDHAVEVKFVPGKFALPSSACLPSPKLTTRRSLKRSDTGQDSFNSASRSTGDADSDSSEWSTTQRGSNVSQAISRSEIILGDLDDISLIDTERVCLVGGTFSIRGLAQDEERQAIVRVLQAVIYTVQAMFYELEMLDSFRIPREADLPPPRRNASRQHTSPIPSRSNSPQSVRNASARESGQRTRSFFHKLGKDTRDVFDGIMGRQKPVEKITVPLSRQSTIRSKERSSQDSSHPRPDVATFSPTTSPILTSDRHLQTLAHLETMLPSPTPGLRIPMPPLLLRLREEETKRNEKIKRDAANETRRERRGSVMGELARLGSLRSLSSEDPLRIRARHYRIGGDVKAGLAVLMGQMDELVGWTKLQRLDTLVCTGIDAHDSGEKTTICERPKPRSFTFWAEDDETIEDVMDAYSDGENVCSRPGCDLDQESHARWYIHNRQKVKMSFRRFETGMGEDGLDVWIKCETCKKTSEPRKLGEIASAFSWGKLLEYVLYTTLLIPPGFCPHAASTPSPIAMYIRSPHHVVTLAVSTVDVLETRLPKLQVGPNVPKRKAGRLGLTGSIEDFTRREPRLIALEQVRLDMQVVIGALVRQIKNMRDRYKGMDGPSPPGGVGEESAASSDTRHVDLEQLQLELEAAESALKDQLEACSTGDLNQARQELLALYERFFSRISSLGEAKDEGETGPDKLPEYFGKGVHALPGSSILVREDEPSSILAHTLASAPYLTSLTGKDTGENTVASQQPTEGWTVDVKRRDSPRDLLPLRAIAKKRSDASVSRSEHRFPLAVTPNQPSLELSLDQVEGKSQATDHLDDLVRSISKATAQDPVLALNTRAQNAASSDAEAGSTHVPTPSAASRHTRASRGAPSSAHRTVSGSSSSVPVMAMTKAIPAPVPTQSQENAHKEGWSSVTSTFASSFNSLMRMGTDVGSFKMRGGDRSLSSLIGPLTMMSAMDTSLSGGNPEDRPHLQFTYTLGEKRSISCTIYYAAAFDSLRRRCAIDRSIIESLSRCESWDAQGGKSKASFFMTADKRYIVKELVSKWNVSDMQALLEIAPSYFEYLASTHNKATSLAKIVAFTTIKINDVPNSTKKTMDLMVMENLFYKQTISQTYDLKGIEGRKVPKASADGTTLFDNEWIEGQSRAPILLYPHAKRILHDAIFNDTKYLCSQSIMDYSLLLGLDEGRHELVVGIVDAIGSYNLFKTIESRSKLALTRGGEVTIIPPDQYRERFETALKQYFVACPDKWSKSARRHTGDTLPCIF